MVTEGSGGYNELNNYIFTKRINVAFNRKVGCLTMEPHIQTYNGPVKPGKSITILY